ncbi:STAS domain-containing protein [Oceanobacillus massiliensis]|uniref:STAS domain-containing protein n=1 Tax=Oceanobacillus massiliensis TaxID=1465765 RepID=UPI000288E4FA|nr:STAS domain-containing protein [Oceanobacillus massiliensis]
MEEMIDVAITIKDKTCRIFVSGILDYATMEAFNEKIRLIDEGTDKVIINFEGLEFIDSTGIGSIINLVHEANDKQFQVELEGINDEVSVLFETIGVFQILETLQKEGK